MSVSRPLAPKRKSALRIHSVEARHASKIRRIRRASNPSDTTLRLSGYVRGGGVAAAGAGNIANPPAAVVAAPSVPVSARMTFENRTNGASVT